MSDSLLELGRSLEGCNRCKLCAERQNVVFGVGSPTAKVMLVGEAPGKNEDEQGEPFVGRGGQLLDKMLDAVGLSRRENIYIANMVKCRPPQNRDPETDELEACLPFLREQVRIIRPKIIVCVGRVASCRLIDPDFKVTRQHGTFFERGDTLMMGTLHPAAILRNPASKADAFEDWLKLERKLAELFPDEYPGLA